MKKVVDGVVMDMTTEEVAAREAEFEAAEPVRRTIPKSVVMERVETRGLLDEVMTILYAPTTEARRALTRWNTPDWPNVFHDDAEVIAMLDLAGATVEDKAYILA